MQLSTKAVSLERAANGSRGKAARDSIYAKITKKKVPTIKRAYVYGVCQPTTGPWFQAKLKRINPTTPVTDPAKSIRSNNLKDEASRLGMGV